MCTPLQMASTSTLFAVGYYEQYFQPLAPQLSFYDPSYLLAIFVIYIRSLEGERYPKPT